MRVQCSRYCSGMWALADWMPFEGEAEGWGTTQRPLNQLRLRRPNPFFTPFTPTMQYAEGPQQAGALCWLLRGWKVRSSSVMPQI